MKIVATAPGKLLLIGEYAVLENAPAVVLAVNRFAEVRISPSGDEFYRVSSPTLNLQSIPFQLHPGRPPVVLQDIPVHSEKMLHFFFAILNYLSEQFLNKDFTPVEFELKTDAFFLSSGGDKLGLGSSAALTVALVAAFVHLTGRDREKILPLSLAAHFAAQGKTGSGVDVAASAIGGLLCFKRQGTSAGLPEIGPLRLPADLKLIPVWSGKPASTREFVNQVQRFKQEQPATFSNSIKRMTRLAADGCNALIRNQGERFMKIYDEYGTAMQLLGETCGVDIMSPVHRQIRAVVREAGGVYKPSGAGGGDLGIALCTGQMSADVSSRLLHSGFKIIKLSPAARGAKIKVE